MELKKPFTIDQALKRIEKTVRPYPKAALFELVEQGFGSTFEILVACIISIRTFDEITLEVAPKLFAKARTPREMSKLSVYELTLTASCLAKKTYCVLFVAWGLSAQT